MLTPGLGHLYSGYPLRGVVVFVLTAIAAACAVAIGVMLPGISQLLALLILAIAIPVAGAADASRMAHRHTQDYALRAYNRSYVYVGVVLISWFIWQPVFLGLLHRNLAEAYKLPSGAMEPTLLTGDFILAAPLRGPVRRGDIVVHHAPTGTFAKRVVALPGDTIAMTSDSLRINGLVVVEPYVQRDSADPVYPEFDWQRKFIVSSSPASYHPSLHNWGPLLLPANQYFLLGDNRNSSLDSRYLGFVDRDSIVARPTIVYFSQNPESGAIRWRRIGRNASR